MAGGALPRLACTGGGSAGGGHSGDPGSQRLLLPRGDGRGVGEVSGQRSHPAPRDRGRMQSGLPLLLHG